MNGSVSGVGNCCCLWEVGLSRSRRGRTIEEALSEVDVKRALYCEKSKMYEAKEK